MQSTAAAASEATARRSGSEKRQRTAGAVLVRLLPAERAALTAKAAQAGLSLAGYLRLAGLGRAGTRAKRAAPGVNITALAQAVAALNKVGGNLNQIAHRLNSGQGAGETVRTLAATQDAVAQIVALTRRKKAAK